MIYPVSVSESCSVMSDSLLPHGLHSPWNSLSQNTGVGNCSLLQGIFSTQGSNPGLPHCRQILYQLSHKGSPRILDWVAIPFFSTLAWKIPWTEEPGGLQSMGGRRVRYNLVTKQLFPGSSAGKESTCNAGDPTSIPGSGRYNNIYT